MRRRYANEVKVYLGDVNWHYASSGSQWKHWRGEWETTISATLCMHACVLMCVCIHVCVKLMCLCCTRVNWCGCVNICVCVCVCVCACACINCVCACVCVRVCACLPWSTPWGTGSTWRRGLFSDGTSSDTAETDIGCYGNKHIRRQMSLLCKICYPLSMVSNTKRPDVHGLQHQETWRPWSPTPRDLTSHGLQHQETWRPWSPTPRDLTSMVSNTKRPDVHGLQHQETWHPWSPTPRDRTFMVSRTKRPDVYGLQDQETWRLWSPGPRDLTFMVSRTTQASAIQRLHRHIMVEENWIWNIQIQGAKLTFLSASECSNLTSHSIRLPIH